MSCRKHHNHQSSIKSVITDVSGNRHLFNVVPPVLNIAAALVFRQILEPVEGFGFILTEENPK